VFGLCLGGNVFGWTLDEQRSFAVLDAYVAAGGNFIDTADTYGRRGDGAGASECIIGRWMASRGNRDDLVIATKVGMSPDMRGLAPETVARAAEESLQRLATDRIDLYYAHQDDPDTPLADTLAAFGRLLADGKIRHAAASNYSAQRLEQALDLAAAGAGTARFAVLQPHYNLVERAEYEAELRDVCAREGLACVPYYGLARGFLSGKYRPGSAEVDSPRAQAVRERYMNARGLGVLAALDEVAGARGKPVAAVSLAWLRAQPTVVAPIASATSVQQLGELLESVTLELTPDELRLLDQASEPGSGR
jgi:aryl-alcohol dehydrogenase-like predicted oxidoreductase